MWIVRIALQRPYTFIVLAVLIVLLGVLSIVKTATDIFPNIRIPVVATIWRYTGLPPEDMANRLVLFSERTAQTVVNDVEHTESQSLNGTAVVKYFFQPRASEELSYAQITGVSQSQIAFSPPGTTPPFILAYNASTVPILQLAFSSESLPENQIFDLANNIVRTQLGTVQGAQMPWPYGGKQRTIMVDLDPAALRAHGLSGADVNAAIGAQNLILPQGTEKIGDLEYFVKLNVSPTRVEELNDIPIRTKSGELVYVRDVAHVRDGATPQTNVVRVGGKRAVLMNVLKTGTASTLQIIDEIKRRLPQIQAALPPEMNVKALSDQSIFVRGAISGVVREAIIAAALTGLMILLFLGSFRSTLIITISIPLSILASIICLSALGETINIMTLGGLALAVGILVDDATVTIENINYHLEQGKDIETAILDGAKQIAVPAFVSTLAICIVFVPMFMLTGIAKYLFVPLAEAVVFAMLASYALSRTLVPTLAKYWLRLHAHIEPKTAFGRFQRGFEQRFASVKQRYHDVLAATLASGPRFAMIFLGAMAATAVLAFPIGPLPGLGQDFFPKVDSGQIRLHLRARAGTRIEETTALCDRVENVIREVIPADELQSLADNIGLPYSGINLSYSTSAPIGPGDADVYIQLNERHHETVKYERALRARLAEEFPSVSFSLLAADIVSQILNFGLPAPIDVQVSGQNTTANRTYINALLAKMRHVAGAADLRIQQAFDYPQINVDVDRTNAATLGLSQRDVATNLLISLSGSFQTSPSFFIDPKSGTQYSVTTQSPQYRVQSLNDLAITPITSANGTATGSTSPVLASVASFRRTAGPAVVSHYNATPALDIYGTFDGTDLGYVVHQIHDIVDASKDELPKGSRVDVRGQAETMISSFNGLLLGLAAAIVLIYLLIVVNFQSWLDPFIIITALPAALAGIVWMLFLTGTTVSVPALTGAIMCMGVATANSILVVSFARERMDAGLSARDAALEAGFTRFRPVLMTAAAMIIGMVPMALGLGDGGEQNAPLGRAVIGGLLFATGATLFFVPTVFSIIHGWRQQRESNSGVATHA
ncbi:MAG TPA: efflux RND transporter permease subunit [Nevskiaceae bacterium]|nr:efflux RND transporter permease subunit [Nevskiaceae bacterium]